MAARIFILFVFLKFAAFAQNEEPLLRDTSSIIIPAAFSPNSDGFEDVLYIKTYYITNYTFQLFDRWGELIYETTDANAGWNGRNKKDKLYDKGAYYYVINYQDSYKKPQRKTGTVELKKK
ncbi:MAG TPA: gliding motility-associated C-terminal domain-containing protein [Bacteroidia bacterium]|nr:gliding motility-associated C-terminal domain-containing protein [Bacteroidia bacterium]